MIRWLRNVWHKLNYGTCVECPFYSLHSKYLNEDRSRRSGPPAREML